MIRKMVVVGLLLAGGVAGAVAQSDPIAQRKQFMKVQGEHWYGDIGKIMKGEAPYDQAKVNAAFDAIKNTTEHFAQLFPDNSKTGEGTRALPAIWEKKAEFEARLAKLATDVDAAKKSVTDLDSLKAAQPGVNANCNQCHQAFRGRT